MSRAAGLAASCFRSANIGAIVNTASVAGIVADPNMSAYVAAKHAVVGLTKAVAIEYAQQGIRVNAIGPGFVATPMTQAWLESDEFKAAFFAQNISGRAAQPEEIAGGDPAPLFRCGKLHQRDFVRDRRGADGALGCALLKDQPRDLLSHHHHSGVGNRKTHKKSVRLTLVMLGRRRGLPVRERVVN